jgi:hypothetical protein
VGRLNFTPSSQRYSYLGTPKFRTRTESQIAKAKKIQTEVLQT